MGAFSGLNDAKRSFNSNWLKPGKFVVRIDSCESFEAEQKGRMWKNNLTILAVDHGDHRVGEAVQTFWKKGEFPKVFFSNIRTFVADLLGVDFEEVTEQVVERIAAEEGGNLRGLVAVVTGLERAQKNRRQEDGSPAMFTHYSWSPALSDEEIMAAIGEEGVARFFPNGL